MNQAATWVQGVATRVMERLPTNQENEIGTEINKDSRIGYIEIQSHTTIMMRSSTLFAMKMEITKQ